MRRRSASALPTAATPPALRGPYPGFLQRALVGTEEPRAGDPVEPAQHDGDPRREQHDADEADDRDEPGVAPDATSKKQNLAVSSGSADT